MKFLGDAPEVSVFFVERMRAMQVLHPLDAEVIIGYLSYIAEHGTLEGGTLNAKSLFYLASVPDAVLHNPGAKLLPVVPDTEGVPGDLASLCIGVTHSDACGRGVSNAI